MRLNCLVIFVLFFFFRPSRHLQNLFLRVSNQFTFHKLGRWGSRSRLFRLENATMKHAFITINLSVEIASEFSMSMKSLWKLGCFFNRLLSPSTTLRSTLRTTFFPDVLGWLYTDAHKLPGAIQKFDKPRNLITLSHFVYLVLSTFFTEVESNFVHEISWRRVQYFSTYCRR